MKRNILSIIAWLLLVIMIGLCVVGCNDTEIPPAQDPAGESDTEATPTVSETESQTETETQTETEPEVSETEPEVSETEPEVSETEPEVSETEPEVSETEPEVSETEPEVSETEPEVSETEPEVSETEPEVETEGASLSYNLKDYAIIRGDASGDFGKNAATGLQNVLKNAGLKPDRPAADTSVAVSDALEILIGKTNRPETEAVAKKLTAENQYAISFRQNKIVIYAERDLLLLHALDAFSELYLSGAVENVITANENHTYIGSVNLVEMGANSVSHYTVVYSFAGDSAALDAANKVANRLKSCLGADAVTCTDDFETYAADAKLIIVGNVDASKFPELETIKADWEPYEYGIKIEGNRIYLIGTIDDAVDEAVAWLVDILTRQTETTEDGKLIAAIPEEGKKELEGYLLKYPQFTDGVQTELFLNTNNGLVYSYRDVTAAEYEAYISVLTEAGFLPTAAEHTIGVNRFQTLIHPEKGQLHVAFYAPKSTDGTGTGNMQIFADPLTDTVAIPQETYDPDTQKVTDTIFHVMSLDYSHREYTDGNGQSYIVTLEDGRYVIFDGGYTQDAAPLHDYLVANNQFTDGKIHIAAWFISHPHEDHFGAIESFTKKYVSEIELEYVVANSPTRSRYGGTHWMIDNMPSVLARTGAKLIKPHTGQVLKFCNTEFEVLLTHENVSATAIDVNDGNSNNSSTVVRMWENGHSILMTMDAADAQSDKLVNLYGTALESDIFQVNHHGHSGGTQRLFETVKAKYLLWTCSQGAFEKRVSGKGYEWISPGSVVPNKWIYESVGGAENCLVADGTIEHITFVDGIAINKDTGLTITPSTT